MEYPTRRRVSGVVGSAILLFVAGVLFVAGSPHSVVVSVQLSTLALAGTCDLISAVDTRLTDRVPWYKWSGAGSVLLGASLPLGLVPSGGWDTETILVVGLMALAGLTIALIGVDLLLFDGEHVFEHPPDGAPVSEH